MSTLSPLLDVQALDLGSDRLREKRVTLPERSALAQNESDTAAVAAARMASEAKRAELEAAEAALGAEVAGIAEKAKEVEATLYSGSVKVPKELDALRQELALTQEKQAAAEERELELLEQIESLDGEMGEQETRRTGLAQAAAELKAAIIAAESAIDEEIGGRDAEARAVREALPAPVLAIYDKLRAKAKLAGRAAAELRAGSCDGCRSKLPVIEHQRIQAEPDDAPVTCPNCARLLVR